MGLQTKLMKTVKVVKSDNDFIIKGSGRRRASEMPLLFHDGKVRAREMRCNLDPEKMWAYESFIKDNCKDKILVDLGCGPGIMGYLALLYGAKEVIFVDIDRDAIQVAEEMTRKFEQPKQFLKSNAAKDTYDWDNVDIILHEIYGHNIYDEFIIHINRNLAIQGYLHKVSPCSIDWWEVTGQRPIMAKDSPEYIADNYPEGTRTFQKEFNENIEDMIKLHHDTMSYFVNSEGVSSNEWKYIGTTDMTVNDKCYWVPKNLSVLKGEHYNRAKYYSWSANLDKECKYSYRGGGRDLNNWGVMPAGKNHKKRFIESVRFGENINPYANI